MDSLILIEKVLPKSAYTGYARPVRYAPFMNLIDPFIRAKEWKRMSEDQRNGYECLVGYFEALFSQQYRFLREIQLFVHGRDKLCTHDSPETTFGYEYGSLRQQSSKARIHTLDETRHVS